MPERAIKTVSVSILAIGLLAGSVIGVAAQDEAGDSHAPAYFTVGWGGPADIIEAEGLVTLVDIDFEATDPRASGLMTMADATRSTLGPTGQDWGVVAHSVRLTNDGGTWTGTGEGFGATETAGGVTIWRLTGEEGYEGMSLFLASGREDGTWGIIVPADYVPAGFPDLPAE